MNEIKMNRKEKVMKMMKIFIAVFVFSLFFGYVYGEDLKIDENIKKINYLSEVLKSTSAKERLDSIYELLKIDDERAVKILVEHYKIEKDNYLKKEIIENINIKKSTEAFKIVEDSLSSSNRQIALSALNKVDEESLKDESFRKEVLKNFKTQKDKSLKITALDKLSVIESSDVVKEISDIVLNENEDSEVRVIAFRKLKNMKSSFAKKEIEKIKGSNINDSKLKKEIGIEEKKNNEKGKKVETNKVKNVKKKN